MTPAPDADALLRAHMPMILRIARSYERDRELVADLAQDIAVAVIRGLRAFRGDCDPKFFVARIAKNCCVSHVASSVRRRGVVSLDERLPSESPGPAHAAEQRERVLDLFEAVEALPLALRQAAVLALEGLTVHEIAQALGIAPNTAAVRMKRARAALAHLLGETP